MGSTATWTSKKIEVNLYIALSRMIIVKVWSPSKLKKVKSLTLYRVFFKLTLEKLYKWSMKIKLIKIFDDLLDNVTIDSLTTLKFIE